MTETATLPELAPGIYTDIPEAEYHALPYVSNSRLGRLAEVPSAVNVPFKTSPAMQIGTAFHAAVLQPERFNDLVAASPVCDKRTKEGTAIYAAFQAGNGHKTIISIDDMASIQNMRDAVMAHPAAAKILSKGITEQTVVWDDLETGLRCKSRIDFEPEGVNVLVDLKTVRSANKRAFTQSVLSYGYARQAAVYLTGRNVHSMKLYDAFVFVCVEATAPYHVEVYNLTPAFLRYGLNEFRRLIRLEKQCRDAQAYPHYNEPGIVDLDAPGYLNTEDMGIFSDYPSAL